MALHIERDTAYTLKEIEEGLGIVKVLTLRRWIAEGKLRAVKMGRAWVVMGRDLLSAIENWPSDKRI
jgi:excisionase family DNA binding protein